MVYIKLDTNIYSRIKNLINPQQLVRIDKDLFIPYPEFKRIAVNHNLHIHQEIGRHDIVTYNDMEVMIEQTKQTPQQKKFIEDLKSKSQIRKLKLINSKGSEDFYLEKKSEQMGVRELTESASYAMAFIFSFFMAGLTGFYVGNYFLGWEFIHSMMLALAFIFVTLIVETSLFILRQMSISQQTARKKAAKEGLRKTKKVQKSGGKDKKQ